MARPITPGDTLPTSPPLKVVAVGKRVDGHLEVTVDLPTGHPDYAAVTAAALDGISAGPITGLLGHPGLPEDDDR